MARGWESKSVEEQIELAGSGRNTSAGRQSEEDRRRQRERESLELSRTRVMRDLGAAMHPRHRALLEAALKHLDEKIAAL
ncbi:MAG: hypothetical protein ACRD11_15810 [Terriglobia bacterium]